MQRIARAVGLGLVSGLALRAARSMRPCPVQITARVDVLFGQVRHRTLEVRDAEGLPEGRAAVMAEREGGCCGLGGIHVDGESLSGNPECPDGLDGVRPNGIRPRDSERIGGVVQRGRDDAAIFEPVGLDIRSGRLGGDTPAHGGVENRGVVCLYCEIVEGPRPGFVRVHDAAVGGGVFETVGGVNTGHRVRVGEQIGGRHAPA